MGKTETLSLDEPVTTLNGVGPRIGERLANLGIGQIRDVLFHLPRKYMDRTRLIPMGSLRHDQEALVEGEIELTQVQYGKRRSLLCRLSDGTGSLTLRFFHFSKGQQNYLRRGSYLQCWGQTRRVGKNLEMIHPEYEHVSENNLGQVEQSLTAVYPATEGISQAKIRKLTEQALQVLNKDEHGLAELLPESVLAEINLPTLYDAICYVHSPPVDADVTKLVDGSHPCQQRLAFEELLAQHLCLRSLREQIHQVPAPEMPREGRLLSEFTQQLPFRLTAAQSSVIDEISTDLDSTTPMLRLVQGDVGSGKTIVAAIAALQAIEAGYQVAYMAPTELLAEQHFHNMQTWFNPLSLNVGLLTGRLTKKQHGQILDQIESSEIQFVIGTHALFQEKVRFLKLGLVIIDEQHRFGVHQRLSLLEKAEKERPHQLIMTATPIPRTLAMTLFADLDISIIDELPPGREEINTIAISNEKREEIIARIATVCRQGRQVYWVCTLIEESDALQCQAATDTCEHLQELLPDLNIGLVHGRMNGSQKQQVMQEFKDARIDLLVATTVIEVGVDVPNASLMVIENSERLGLSQLHQLRGRVGRGNTKSDCVLIYQGPLSDFAQSRLQIMRETNDGFKIAEKDMELRGPGDLLGTRQTGLPALRIADLGRDAVLLPAVQKTANILLTQYPKHVQSLIKRWTADRLMFGKV